MATIKVNREGIVTSDGTAIGHVVKEQRQGFFFQMATSVGVGYSGAGTPFWIPFSADGTKLHDGYETRKRAVARIESHAKPLEITGLKIERSWADVPFVSGWLTNQGFSYSISRYASESRWIVDALFTPNSMMPVFSNGSGTRFTSAKGLLDEFDDAATKAAIAAGVWPIGADVCAVTGKPDCAERDCELHYMDAPLNLKGEN